jgi:hypothetical protein
MPDLLSIELTAIHIRPLSSNKGSSQVIVQGVDSDAFGQGVIREVND